MTQETFDTAIKLYLRLQELRAAKSEIDRVTRLIYQYSDYSGSWHETSEYRMQYISEILDRHDKQIRADIDAEIEAINKQIETL